jgi:hypothetical protein
MNPGRFLRALLSFPLTWMVLLVTAVAEWSFFSWFQPSFIMSVAAAALGVVLLLLWPVIVARAATFSSAYYDTPSRPTRDSPASLAELADELKQLGVPEGAQQMQKLAPLLDNLRAVLNRRLSAGELTYGRYLGAAEQVANSVVDNLRDVDVTLRSVRSIDAEGIAARLKQLRSGGGFVREEQRREIKSLEERATLVEKQNKRVAELLAQNESALTILVDVATAVANTETEAGKTGADAEAAMAELERLAKRAGRYAVTPAASSA